MLWQTDIEGRTPRELADELELAPTAVAALAFRAREGLADAYLAAHVTYRPTAQCNREPSELARYVRNRMRSKEQVTFRAHLDQCLRCSEAVEELRVVSRPLRSLQWPALIGAPAITYGGKVIGIIRRVVTAQLVTTAGAAAVTVATVGVATDRVPFEPFDALRPTAYVESQAAAPAVGAMAHGSSKAGAASEAAATAPGAARGGTGTGSTAGHGSHRSAIFPATSAAIPTIALTIGTTAATPATRPPPRRPRRRVSTLRPRRAPRPEPRRRARPPPATAPAGHVRHADHPGGTGHVGTGHHGRRRRRGEPGRRHHRVVDRRRQRADPHDDGAGPDGDHARGAPRSRWPRSAATPRRSRTTPTATSRRSRCRPPRRPRRRPRPSRTTPAPADATGRRP